MRVFWVLAVVFLLHKPSETNEQKVLPKSGKSETLPGTAFVKGQLE